MRAFCLLGWFCVWALGLVLPAVAQVPVPPLTARAMDLTGTLSAADVAGLEEKLARFEREQGTQVVVLVLHTTQPEDITSYTQRLGDTWKIGRSDVGDGVLLVVAKDDRRMRIATTKTLEGALPDLLASRIIDQVIAPFCRVNDYAGGLHAGVDQVLAQLKGENLPLPEPEAPDGWTDMLVFLGFAAPILSAVFRQMLGKRLGSLVSGVAIGGMAWHLTGVLWLALLVGVLAVVVGLIWQAPQRSAWRGRGGRLGSGGHGPHTGGGWGGGAGGGGFSSGGGGDFGGGGASGNW